MNENPYFATADARREEQEQSDKAEQAGSYPQGKKTDVMIQAESAETVLDNGDVTVF
ncbi:hypothetical protein [Paenibacillus contaminans]|uniref:hypothetical protein n=1 Tax=Paenibacillus contaminans TaxID=450362 RepID=UPI0013140706|nr:hypothetical protein [Paenibacillus contaminans]